MGKTMAKDRVRRVSKSVAALGLALVATASGGAGAAPERTLILGFAPPKIQSLAKGFVCPAMVPLAHNFATPNKYAAGAAQDVKDAANAAAFQADEKSLSALVKFSNDLSLQYLQTGDAAVARCLTSALAAQAKAGALTGELSDAAVNLRIFATPALAFGYAAVKTAHTAGNGDDKAIETWLRTINDPGMAKEGALVARGNGPGAPHRVNNMYYWTGYGALMVGVATQDKPRFEWGRQAILTGLNTVDDNGFLPPEAARDSQALQYHAFALQPLSMGVVVLQANRTPPSADQMRALLRVSERTANGILDPLAFGQDMARFGVGKNVAQVDVPKAPPFVAVVTHLLGPMPQVNRLGLKFSKSSSGWIGPSTEDLFALPQNR